MKNKTKIVQVSNIAPQATKDQVSALFSYIGKIDDIRLFPTIRDVAIPVQSRICFIKFNERDTAGVAQHLTNVVFIDRALLVIPYVAGDLPDEPKAIELLNSTAIFPGLVQEVTWPAHVENEIDGIILHTKDPKLNELGLPEYPNLPATTESFKVNEIRRTLVFDNIPVETSPEELEAFASSAGEVKYLRMGAEDAATGITNALVEYCDQTAIPAALQLHSHVLNGNQINVNHSTEAIIKPQTKSNDAAVREIEDAMARVKQAQSILAASVDSAALPDTVVKETKPDKSRSRSRSRHRSRSPSRRSSRSRSRHCRRSRSKSRSRHHSRSKSHSRRRSGSRSKRHSRSRSPHSKSSRRHKDDKHDKDKDKDKKKSSGDSEKKDKDRKEKENKKEKTSKETSSKEENKPISTEGDLIVQVEKEEAEEKPKTVVKECEAVEHEVEPMETDEPVEEKEKVEPSKVEDKKHEEKKVEKKSKEKSSRRSRSGSPKRSSRRHSRSGSRGHRSSRRHRSRSKEKRRSRSPASRSSRRSRSKEKRRSRSPTSRSTTSRRSASPGHRRDSRRSRSKDRRDRKDKDRKTRDSTDRNAKDGRDHDKRDRRDRDKRESTDVRDGHETREHEQDKEHDRKDRKKERRDREDRKEKDKKEDRGKDKDRDKEDKKAVVARNYDEEEMGYEKNEGRKDEKSSSAVDMDISP